MNRTSDIQRLDTVLCGVIDEVLESYGHEILRGSLNQVVKNKAEGEVTRSFDALIESMIIDSLTKTGIPLRIDSEELGIVELSDNPQYLVVLDPLDGSDMAARGIPLCSIAVSVVDIATREAVISRIGEIVTGGQYFAGPNGFGHTFREMRPSSAVECADAFVVLYAAKRERIGRITEVAALLSKCKMYLNYGGPLDVARIATGQVDVVFEYVRGMAPRDTLAGMHILQSAGGVIIGGDGERVNGRVFVEGRRKFVAAGTERLARTIFNGLREAGAL